MLRRYVALLTVGFALGAVVLSQGAGELKADTLFVLKNGAEVRGVFVEIKDGQYKLRLPDGRVMSYPAGDVEKMERLPISVSQPSPSPSPTPFPSPEPTLPPPPIDPSSCRTFITEKSVDKALYTTIKDIKVSKKWYGSTEEMYGDLAAKAREVGADAVINARTWHSPSGFAWAAPHAGGIAVKWTEAGCSGPSRVGASFR